MTRVLKMSKVVFIAFAFCFTKTCFSQENFKKGYIIKSDGDTLSGLVDYREGFRSYRICQFKSVFDQSVATYTPDDIRGYGMINGKTFQSKKITEANGVLKNVFLDMKIIGFVTLYKYEYVFYVQKSSDSLQRLSNDKSQQLIDGKQVVRYTNQHIAVLSTMLFDCIALRERTQKVPFVERQITTLIEDYNACQSVAQTVVEASKSWAKVMVGLTGGVHFSRLEIASRSSADRRLDGSYDVTNTPFFGATFDLSSPRLTERLSFHGAVMYLHPKYRMDHTTGTSVTQVEIATNQIKIPVGFRYTFRGEPAAPYLNLGISSTFNFSSTSTWDQKFRNGTSQYETNLWTMRTNQMGLWGGVGIAISLNKYLGAFLEIRYEETQSLGNLTMTAKGVFSEVKNVQVIIGIRKK